jgi:hypothetical protein
MSIPLSHDGYFVARLALDKERFFEASHLLQETFVTNQWLLPVVLIAFVSCQSIALDEVARKEESEDHWKEALEAWRNWQPGSFCGTCLEALEAEKDYHIAICLERLHREPGEAKDRYLKALPALGQDDSMTCARRLLALHEAEGTVGELRRNIARISTAGFLNWSEGIQWLKEKVKEP